MWSRRWPDITIKQWPIPRSWWPGTIINQAANMEVILLLGEVCPLLPSHYWQEGRRGHAGRREAKTPLSHRPLVVFQHRASGLQCFNIGLWWKCFMPKSAAMLLVPPHKAHNSQHVFIVYPANIDPLSQEHNSRQFSFISSDHPWSKH